MSDAAFAFPRQGDVIRSLEEHDLDRITSDHRNHFPENVMGRLGPAFLRSYYRTFLDAPHAIALVAEHEGVPSGFLVGILDTRRHRQWLKRKHGWSLALTGLAGLLRHPRIGTRLVVRRITLRLRGTSSPGGLPAEPSGSPVAVLSHVAVDEHARGLGIGRHLVEEFSQAARRHGAGRACLATLDGEGGAGPFYTHHGWTLTARRQTFDGRWIQLYELRLRADD